MDPEHKLQLDLSEYHKEYCQLEVPGLAIRRGFEFGMLPGNREQFQKDIKLRDWDFVIGSVHFVDDLDVYFPEYWEGKTPYYAILRSLLTKTRIFISLKIQKLPSKSIFLLFLALLKK